MNNSAAVANCNRSENLKHDRLDRKIIELRRVEELLQLLVYEFEYQVESRLLCAHDVLQSKMAVKSALLTARCSGALALAAARFLGLPCLGCRRWRSVARYFDCKAYVELNLLYGDELSRFSVYPFVYDAVRAVAYFFVSLVTKDSSLTERFALRRFCVSFVLVRTRLHFLTRIHHDGGLIFAFKNLQNR